MSKVILICGKICSGKSYYANQIKERENAVILSIDEMTYDLIDNKQGEFYNKFTDKGKGYLEKKTVEFVNAGCNVILDWGFWTINERKEITEYFKLHNIQYEWHYIDIDYEAWYKNIEERNKKIKDSKGSCNFFVDEGLLRKTIELFEIPDKSEIDVWYKNK